MEEFKNTEQPMHDVLDMIKGSKNYNEWETAVKLMESWIGPRKIITSEEEN